MAPSVLRLASWLAAVASVTAGPLEPRAVINHDAVVGFPETVPEGIIGRLYRKYKPYLDVVNGCVPFPAVDAAGNTSGGLKPTGPSNGGCSSSRGQVYVRGAPYNGAYAIMYSYYFPKDEPSQWIGHRHDFENAVVWLSAASDSATILGIAVSSHGQYHKKTSDLFYAYGTHPLLGYQSDWPTDHHLVFSTVQGGQQPMVAWQSLTEAARIALDRTDFGEANVPMNNANFFNNLGKASL